MDRTECARDEDLPAIPIYRPDLSGNERRYVLECLDSSWISSVGPFVERFEAAVGAAVGAPHVIGVSNGSVALHLALHCLGIGPGDEVIVPALTFIAPVNAIVQTGATPVFAESRPSDWLIDPADIERRITPRTKAILPVHLYGAVCDMNRIEAIAQRHDLKVVEDCAEALGAKVGTRHAGTFGDVGTLSFFGNKTVTTGEGGAVFTADPALARHMRLTKGQGQSPTRRYWHDRLGFNYRLANINAAIGLAQIERLDAVLVRKGEIAAIYKHEMDDLSIGLQVLSHDVTSSNWLTSILLPDGTDREALMRAMAETDGIETRPLFYPAHHMPMHRREQTFPIAEGISARGLSLPSYPGLSDGDLARVVTSLKRRLCDQHVDTTAGHA